MKIENEITFGATYRDIYTGFEGLAIGFCTYQTGCDQVLITPTSLLSDGKKPTSEWFDVARLQRVEGVPLRKLLSSAGNERIVTGGDRLPEAR